MSHYRNPDEADRHHSHGVAEQEAYEEGIAEGERRERARTVRFLREWQPLEPGHGVGSLDTASEQAARALERGDHIASAEGE